MRKKSDSKRKTLSESLPGWVLQAVFNPYVLLFTLLSSTFSALYSSHMNHGLPTTLLTSEISQLDHYFFCMFCWVSTLSFMKNLLRVLFHALFLILSPIKNVLFQKCKYTISDNTLTLNRSYPLLRINQILNLWVFNPLGSQWDHYNYSKNMSIKPYL